MNIGDKDMYKHSDEQSDITLETVIGDGSLENYISYWLEEIVRKRVRPSTFERYNERIYGYIVPELGKIPIRALSKKQVQNFIDGLSAKGLAPSTVTNAAKLLRTSIKEAYSLGFVDENPCDSLTMPNVNSSNAPVLTLQDQLLLQQIMTFADQSVEVSMLLSLYAGLSTGEICALRWRDVELASGTLAVRGILQRIKVFNEGKSKTVIMENAQKGKHAERRIPLPSGLLDKLRKYGENLPKDYYVLSGNRKPIEPRTLRLRFDKAVSAVGLNVTYQTLRRTYIMRCLECDCDAETLSRMLGHTNVQTTLNMRVYSAYEREKQITERVWDCGKK